MQMVSVTLLLSKHSSRNSKAKLNLYNLKNSAQAEFFYTLQSFSTNTLDNILFHNKKNTLPK